MSNQPPRPLIAASALLVFLIAFSEAGHAFLVNYEVGATGQTATADYSFLSGTELQIVLTETTPAATSSLVGADAILTSLGFRLPDDAVIVLPGTVVVSPGSASVGFDVAVGAGDDVSGEWGATIGGEEPIDSQGDFDFVSVLAAQVTQFSGANRDGPNSLDGPQGGLLDDSAARGGLGVIDNSVTISLTLDANPPTSGNQGLSAAQQLAFLDSLSSNSIIEYGSNAAFGFPDGNGTVPGQEGVPEPGTAALLGVGLLWLTRVRRKRRARLPAPA